MKSPEREPFACDDDRPLHVVRESHLPHDYFDELRPPWWRLAIALVAFLVLLGAVIKLLWGA